MSVAVIDRTLNLDARDVDVAKVAVVDLNPRTRVLLHGPIVPTLLLMAWPRVLGSCIWLVLARRRAACGHRLWRMALSLPSRLAMNHTVLTHISRKGDLKCPSQKSTSPRANMTRLA
ncbi:MAG TPA: hypothetical protein VF014_09120 [Casimicrobiaceae bacterium]|nr:hypothetical protein [Casimicrobiaceae bacterium]